MAKLIEVEERDLNFIFGRSKPYSLDVYQRDYRWADDKDYKIVTQLLLDLELRFEHNFKQHKQHDSPDLTAILKDVEENFNAYFLNTIMLNEQGSDIFIVDGQQRLTTLMLLLVKLYHLGKKEITAGINVELLIGQKIYNEDMAGSKHFKISNPDRNHIIQKIFDKTDITDEDITNITQANLKANFLVISRYYNRYFYIDGVFMAEKYQYYVYFLLLKVLIIEQIIKRKEDVAMIFETANDRGKELEPHEVLKGMLLGVLQGEVKEDCNRIWNTGLQTFFKLDGNYQNVDEFFRTYFRAKYTGTKTTYQSFSGKYHRHLLSNDQILEDLDRTKPNKIESFIRKDFQFYYKAYLDILNAAKEGTEISIASNYANEQGQQYLLILSALQLNDPKKKEKMGLVARKLDQFYTLTRLVGIYDSNEHQRAIYKINEAIRNQPLEGISAQFDRVVIEYFSEKDIRIEDLNEIFQYKYFERVKLDGRFTKYVLARVDSFLADILSEQSFAKQETLHFITHSGSKPVHGFHAEHIFAYNEKIMDQFKDENGELDEKYFNDERNRLGAIILLKGNENIRKGNQVYKDKLESYKQSGFIWNRILTDSINKASINSCTHHIKNKFKSYQPDTEGLLSISAINERQELLFELIKEIYKN